MITWKEKIVRRPFSQKHCQRLLFHYCAILLILCQNLPLILPILFQEDDSSTTGTRCFCDKKNCGAGSLVCAGRFCLIGVRHEDGADGQGRLDQHCLEKDGTLPKGKGCARDWHQWSEVCICEENLCNTWAFLRAQMDSSPIFGGQNFRHHSNNQKTSAVAAAPAAELFRAAGGALAMDHSADDGHPPRQRMLTPYDSDANALAARHATDPLGFDRDADESAHQRRGGPALILLLVVLPLVVGAFTVILVFLNYHCNML